MRALRVLLLAAALAVGVFGLQLGNALAAPPVQAPVPDRSCLSPAAQKHSALSLAEARACAPEATLLKAEHGLVTRAGRYIVPYRDGYLLMGFGIRLFQHGILTDAKADGACDYYSGGSFREIYSWAYGGNIYTTEDSGNCVFTGWAVYNLWNSTSCQFVEGTCQQYPFVRCNWCFQINPGVDFIGVYSSGLGQDQWGIRQYLDANWNQSMWAY